MRKASNPRMRREGNEAFRAGNVMAFEKGGAPSAKGGTPLETGVEPLQPAGRGARADGTCEHRFVCGPPARDGAALGICRHCDEHRWFAGQMEEAAYSAGAKPVNGEGEGAAGVALAPNPKTRRRRRGAELQIR